MDINDPNLLDPNASPKDEIPPLRTFKVRIYDATERLKELVIQAHTFSFTPTGALHFEEFAHFPGLQTDQRPIFLTRRAFNASTWYDIEEVVDSGNGTLGNTVTKLAKSLLN